MATTNNNNCVPFWALPPFALPSGGQYGDVLVKKSNADYDAKWEKVEGVGSGLPEMNNDTAGMYLTNEDGVPLWKPVASGSDIPSATQSGFLSAVEDKDEGSYVYSWANNIPARSVRRKYTAVNLPIVFTPDLMSTVCTVDTVFNTSIATAKTYLIAIRGQIDNGTISTNFTTTAIVYGEELSTGNRVGFPSVIYWQGKDSSQPCVFNFTMNLLSIPVSNYNGYFSITASDVLENNNITLTVGSILFTELGVGV